MRRMLFCFSLVLAAVLAACGGGGPSSAQLSLTWRNDARQGDLIATATATACARTRLVELVAAKGDTGIAILLLPVDSVPVPGVLPVASPLTRSEPRPAAMVAVRWFETISVDGFESTGGEVTLDAVDATGLTGRFQVRLQSVEAIDTLVVEGRFDRVPLRWGAPECGQTSRRNVTG